MEFPTGYHPELIGEFAERQAAQQRILIAGLAAMLVIFGLSACRSGSWRLAIMSFLSLPVALVGGVWRRSWPMTACSRSVRWLGSSRF